MSVLHTTCLTHHLGPPELIISEHLCCSSHLCATLHSTVRENQQQHSNDGLKGTQSCPHQPTVPERWASQTDILSRHFSLKHLPWSFGLNSLVLSQTWNNPFEINYSQEATSCRILEWSKNGKDHQKDRSDTESGSLLKTYAKAVVCGLRQITELQRTSVFLPLSPDSHLSALLQHRLPGAVVLYSGCRVASSGVLLKHRCLGLISQGFLFNYSGHIQPGHRAS